MSETKALTHNIKLFVWDGALEGAYRGFVDIFGVAYCLLLEATTLQIAFLASLPIFLGSLIQLKAPYLINKIGSRKRMMLSGIYLQTATTLGMAFAFLLGNKIGTNALVAGFCITIITTQIVNPAWNSWVGELVPQKDHGKFFAKRTRLNHIFMFVASLAGGAFLNWMTKKWNLAPIGFCILYITGSCIRLFSSLVIRRIHEPVLEKNIKEEVVRLGNFFKNIFHTNFGRFTLFASVTNLCLFLSNPFVGPYFLKDLQVNYLVYSLLFATLLVGKFAFYPLWGALADEKGSKKILNISACLFGFAPILYLFSSHLFYIFFVQAYRAITWSGFEVTSFKFLMDATNRKNRSHYSSYNNALNGTLGITGSMAGSLLVHNHLFSSSYFLAFLTAGCLQLVATAIFLPKIKPPQTSDSASFKTAWPMAGAEVSPGESVPNK